MNRFEKYCWEHWVKDSCFGAVFLIHQQLCIFKSKFFKIFSIQYKPGKSIRVQEFMGIHNE